MTTEILVKPANVQEQVLARISEMRQEDYKMELIKCKETREVDLKRIVKERFEYLTERYFKVSRKRIRELPDQELKVLLDLTYERAQKIMARKRVLSFSVIGWVWIVFSLMGFDEKVFLNEIHDLKLILKDQYNPVAIIRNNE
jgi:hypothetical protein